MADLERLKRIHKDMLKFFYEHRLFTTKEFVEFCKRRWNVSRITSQRWLKEHVEEGIIIKFKKGLYKVPEEIVAKLEMLVEEVDSDGLQM